MKLEEVQNWASSLFFTIAKEGMIMSAEMTRRLVHSAEIVSKYDELVQTYNEYELPPEKEKIDGKEQGKIVRGALKLWFRVSKSKEATIDDKERAAKLLVMAIDARKYRLDLSKVMDKLGIRYLYKLYY